MSAAAISRDNTEQYAWGENSLGQRCRGWRLVRDANLSVIEEAMPPGAAEQIHRHHLAQQFFYILAGEAVMEFADKKVAIREGQGVSVDPGVPHRISNLSNSDVRFLVISQPSTSNGDRENLSGWPPEKSLNTRFKTETK
jgi:mannose-6-phosphate isomerase-like protein (cupin superfamily)